MGERTALIKRLNFYVSKNRQIKCVALVYTIWLATPS